MAPDTFRAFRAHRHETAVHRTLDMISLDDLMDGDLTVRVLWSSVNYKDGLATVADGKVARISPIVPGIDLVGEVTTDESATFAPGQLVVAHGHDIGVAHHGGYAEFARMPAEWAFAMPAALSPRDVMAIGTAGYTAALSVRALLRHGLTPDAGKVLVTGATGGVGSVAVALLSRHGFDVVASTGKADQAEWLASLGATGIIDRVTLEEGSARPLERQQWAAAVDCVGGMTLAHVLKSVAYGGAVAASGNTGGVALETSVFPFILRAVTLIGIDSVATPSPEREAVWEWIGEQLAEHALLDDVEQTGLEDVEQQLDRILAGGMRGRVVVRVGADA